MTTEKQIEDIIETRHKAGLKLLERSYRQVQWYYNFDQITDTNFICKSKNKKVKIIYFVEHDYYVRLDRIDEHLREYYAYSSGHAFGVAHAYMDIFMQKSLGVFPDKETS